MSKPEVTLSNWREVYQYYGDHRPSSLALHALHRAASIAYRPQVQYAAGAADKLDELLEADTRLFIVCNHLHVLDQFPVAAMMQRGPMHRVIGNTATLAKQPYFEQVWRRPFDATGSIPVWREQDIHGSVKPAERLEIAKALFRAVTDRVADGASVLIFPEGTRNRGNPRELGEVKTGIGRMILAARARGLPVAIAPVGLWPGDDKQHSLRPSMAVGLPLDELAGLNIRQITTLTAGAMTDALHSAQELSKTSSIEQRGTIRGEQPF